MRVNNKKQQLNNKNKSREKTIYFREQRTNQCQQSKKKRSAVLPARAPPRGEHDKKEKNTEKQICSVGFIRKQKKRKQIHAKQHTLRHKHTQKIL